MKRDLSWQLAWLRLRHHVLVLGWPAFLGLGLLIGAGAVELFASSEADARIDALRETKNALRARLASAAPQAAGGAQLADLPDHAAIDAAIAEIHAAAQKNGVRLEQGEYRLQPEQGTHLARYRIVFPAKGSYPRLHAWLDEAIAARAGLAVDEFALKRDDIGSEMLEARISLSLLVSERR